MNKLKNWYNKIEEGIVCVLTVIGLGLIFYNVVSRYVFHSPHPETDEIYLILLSIAIILGFSVNISEDNNIDMDLVYNMIQNKPAIKTAFDIFRKICMCVYSAFIAFYGYKSFALQLSTGRAFPLTQIPYWVAYGIIPVIGVLMTIRTFYQLFKYFADRKKEEKTE